MPTKDKSGYCEISGEFCDSLDEHHLIPREFGGINGPTISISPTIHQTLHRIYRDDNKVAKFISRYPVSAFKIRQAIKLLRYSSENLPKVQSNQVVINLNNFSDREKNILTRNAENANMPISELVVKIIKKFLEFG